ncbi:hypothetical protein VNO80_00800 [Phaseolus coccineus]|uniref:F-box domain-containing protein n=1 Tax=Phaseolus coccineus TaxID=3886 RepID=A0AAN9RQY0_PHACN
MAGRRRKKKREEGEDRISKLSDDVLCHILSFLTTKEATVTSLLSRRWRLLYSMLPSLHIRCSKQIIQHYSNVDIFVAKHTPQNITAFHLHCDTPDYCCAYYAEEWVSAVVAKKVQNIDISFCHSEEIVLFFNTLFTSSTLVTLNITGSIHLHIPSSVHLPNLNTLNLRVHSCFPLSNLCKLISKSPALKLFYHRPKFFGSQLDEMKIVHNSGQIQVFYANWLCDLFIESDGDYDFISDVLALRTWPKIVRVKAYMTVHFEATSFYVDRILGGLRNVERLYMKYFRDRVTPSHSLPQFNNLVELRLVLRRNDSLFDKFPTKCPKLKVLEFNIMDKLSCITERYRFNVRDGVRQNDLSTRLEPFKHRTKVENAD